MKSSSRANAQTSTAERWIDRILWLVVLLLIAMSIVETFNSQPSIQKWPNLRIDSEVALALGVFVMLVTRRLETAVQSFADKVNGPAVFVVDTPPTSDGGNQRVRTIGWGGTANPFLRSLFWAAIGISSSILVTRFDNPVVSRRGNLLLALFLNFTIGLILWITSRSIEKFVIESSNSFRNTLRVYPPPVIDNRIQVDLRDPVLSAHLREVCKHSIDEMPDYDALSVAILYEYLKGGLIPSKGVTEVVVLTPGNLAVHDEIDKMKDNLEKICDQILDESGLIRDAACDELLKLLNSWLGIKDKDHEEFVRKGLVERGLRNDDTWKLFVRTIPADLREQCGRLVIRPS